MDLADVASVSAEKLVQLLDAAEGQQGEWTADELEAIWQHQLQVVIEKEWLSPQAAELSLLTPKTYRQILLEKTSSLRELGQIREFAKLHLAHEQSPLPKEIAHGLYFAAIAAALVHHDMSITHLQDRQIGAGLAWCLAQPWLDVNTRMLIAVARQKVSVGHY